MQKILSLHWGFSIGGVGKYASIIDKVSDYSDVHIKSACILSNDRQVDSNTLNELKDKVIISRSNSLNLNWIKELKQCAAEFEPDLIITHGFNAHFIALTCLPLYAKVCTYHGDYHANTVQKRILGLFFNRFTEYFISKKTLGCICVARYCKTYLENKNISSNKLTVIHNGINEKNPTSNNREILRQEWSVTEDEILLGVASRLDPVKGISYLIDTFQLLSEKYKNIKLVVIGVGTLEEKLKEQALKHKLQKSNVITGFRNDINDCLNAIDIFILPSLEEYHSIALLEAMRASKQIVATNVGGNTESVRHDQEGLIVASKSSHEIAAAVSKLLENPEKGKELAIAAKKRFSQFFTEKTTVLKTANWLENIK